MSGNCFDIALGICFITVGRWMEFLLMYKYHRSVFHMVDKSPIVNQSVHQGSQQLSSLF